MLGTILFLLCAFHKNLLEGNALLKRVAHPSMVKTTLLVFLILRRRKIMCSSIALEDFKQQGNGGKEGYFQGALLR